MHENSKLYYHTSETFRLPLHVDMRNRVVLTDASDIPMLMWPNGSWCFVANVYMLNLFNRGLSRLNRGGSLLTYATYISPLIRFAYHNKFDLSEITDNQFSLFINLLQAEMRHGDPERRARNSNNVRAIGSTCLDFLKYIGRLNQDENFVGPNGQIRAELKKFSTKKSTHDNRSYFVGESWHHRSFPTADPFKKRLPISSINIEKIRNVIQSACNTLFQRKRSYVMLKLLEITGGRRSEVAAITVESVLNASTMAEPALGLITLKKGDGKTHRREIPIASHDVAFLMDYIEFNRRRIIRQTCGSTLDGGHLLINERTGKRLRSNTITQEVSYFAKIAGIKEKSCPHMFRHRFITKIFVALIEQHEFENADNFRQALMDTEAIKQKVQQLTGHSNLSSLDVYIDLAFEELTNFKGSYNSVHAKLALNSFTGTLKQMKLELKNGASAIEIANRLSTYIEALENDLEHGVAE